MEVVEFGSLTAEHRQALEGDEPDPFDAAGIGLQFRLPRGSGRPLSKLGFREVLSDVRVEQLSGFATMTQRTMWIAVRGDAPWPHGEVTVHSLPF